jgi:hypothetical protein
MGSQGQRVRCYRSTTRRSRAGTRRVRALRQDGTSSRIPTRYSAYRRAAHQISSTRPTPSRPMSRFPREAPRVPMIAAINGLTPMIFSSRVELARHLSCGVRQPFHQEGGGTHPHLDRAEWGLSVSRRWRMAFGFSSSLYCTTSSTSSCSPACATFLPPFLDFILTLGKPTVEARREVPERASG